MQKVRKQKKFLTFCVYRRRISVILYYIYPKTTHFCLHTVVFAPLFLAKRQMGKYRDGYLICEVHDNGPFHLVAYRRIMIAINR